MADGRRPARLSSLQPAASSLQPLPKQRPHDDLRPGLEAVELGENLARRGGSRRPECRLSRWRTAGSLDVAEVDDAEVDLADRRFVVVDQPDALLAVRRRR